MIFLEFNLHQIENEKEFEGFNLPMIGGKILYLYHYSLEFSLIKKNDRNIPGLGSDPV